MGSPGLVEASVRRWSSVYHSAVTPLLDVLCSSVLHATRELLQHCPPHPHPAAGQRAEEERKDKDCSLRWISSMSHLLWFLYTILTQMCLNATSRYKGEWDLLAISWEHPVPKWFSGPEGGERDVMKHPAVSEMLASFPFNFLALTHTLASFMAMVADTSASTTSATSFLLCGFPFLPCYRHVLSTSLPNQNIKLFY